MPREFTFELTIREGNDEFWESLAGSPGIVEVTQLVADCLTDQGFFIGSGESNALILKRFQWVEDNGITIKEPDDLAQ